MEERLSLQLKTRTKKVHREAERVHFMRQFVRGKVERYWYRLLLIDLYYVYTALEEESEKNRSDQLFKSIYFPRELNRKQHIEEDLVFYCGEEWKDEIRESYATKSYVQRIRELGKEDPFLLVAHHYTRYLGDLSGGQILRSICVKAMDLNVETDEGVRFFNFDNVANPKEFKDNYRENLDQMSVSQERKDELCEEAIRAFQFNIALFKELDEWSGYVESD